MKASVCNWTFRLRQTAGMTLPSPLSAAIQRTFADEAGCRRDIDAPLIASASGNRLEEPVTGSLAQDALLWRRLFDPQSDFEDLLEANAAAPLLSHAPTEPLESFIESELCGLHALFNIAVRRQDSLSLARAMSAAAWHIENTQPDNATNHPWAIHAFIWLAHTRSNAEAELLAETQLHACQVMLARPDLRSAYILLDAANVLALTGAS